MSDDKAGPNRLSDSPVLEAVEALFGAHLCSGSMDDLGNCRDLFTQNC